MVQDGIVVAGAEGSRSVVTVRAFKAGERVLVIDGPLTDRPSRYSVQIAAGVHVDLPPDPALAADTTRFPWRFVNHACDPATRLVGRMLVALRALVPGDAVTFDYETTEWEMACPFVCGCGGCPGRTVRGFRFLEPAELERRRPLLAPHLADLAALDGPPGRAA